jgi:TPR repeat protein
MLTEDLNDLESASEFFNFSAKMGHARSMHKIGIMLLYGRGVVSKPMSAKFFFSKIIKAGSDHITTVYYNCMCALSVPSPGVPPAAHVTKEALKTLRASANKGLEYHLNHPWCEVLEVEESETRTCLAQAQLVLGRKYLTGSFLGQNVDEALRWLIESARLGNTDAMCTIGDAFTFQTAGTVQNIVLARKYFTLASSLGHRKAQRRLDSLSDWE